MSAPVIKFEDGAAYDRMMGVWTQFVGAQFLEWLQPAAGQRWLDVGCGTGAFTQQIIDTAKPVAVDGIDPSPNRLNSPATAPVPRWLVSGPAMPWRCPMKTMPSTWR